MSKATRLTFLCRGATAANRQSRFTSDEELLPDQTERIWSVSKALPAYGSVLAAPETSVRETVAFLGAPQKRCLELRDVDYGRWTDRSLTEIAAEEPDALQTWIRDPSAAPHGGESFEQANRRVADWLDSQLAAGGHRVAVTHAIVMKFVVLHVLDAPLASSWRIDVQPLSLLTISSDGERWALRSFNAVI